jgi:MSHA biogenesis protein MshO
MTTGRRIKRPSTRHQRGFTLVEAVVVMVITGILAGIMVLFIRRPVQNYTDAAARADLSDAADLALRRMARELRTALPNSVRLTATPAGQWWLEFIPTKSGGKYLAVENNPDPNANALVGKPLSFTSQAVSPFNVIGPMPAVAVGDFFVIYNLGTGFVGADAYTRTNLARITGFDNANRSISYDNTVPAQAGINPFYAAPGNVPNTSPDQRFQVVGRPVIFRCEGNAKGTGTLTRSVASDFFVQPPLPLASNGTLMANNVVACDFTIGTSGSQQSGLIGLNLALGRANLEGGNAVETITLSHQIHVDNTP